LVCIYGRNNEKLKAIEKELNVNTTNNINDILGDSNIDLVDICLPTKLHCQYAIEAIENGKNVFCETPVSMNTDESEKMKLVAKKYKKNIFVDLFYKFSAPHNIAINKIKNNELGKILTVNTITRLRKYGETWVYR